VTRDSVQPDTEIDFLIVSEERSMTEISLCIFVIYALVESTTAINRGELKPVMDLTEVKSFRETTSSLFELFTRINPWPLFVTILSATSPRLRPLCVLNISCSTVVSIELIKVMEAFPQLKFPSLTTKTPF
jgi:hypothetical protein